MEGNFEKIWSQNVSEIDLCCVNFTFYYWQIFHIKFHIKLLYLLGRKKCSEKPFFKFVASKMLVKLTKGGWRWMQFFLEMMEGLTLGLDGKIEWGNTDREKCRIWIWTGTCFLLWLIGGMIKTYFVYERNFLLVLYYY